MNFVGEKVTNIKYGSGTIVNATDSVLFIRFDQFSDEVKKFIYPKCFEKFLTAENPEIQNAMMEMIRKKADLEAQEAMQKKREKEEAIALMKKVYSHTAAEKPQVNKAINSRSTRSGRSYRRENVAFKCTYCDGGKTEDRIGFCGLCSDENIANNVRNKRDWCNTGPLCIRRYNHEITRSEYESLAGSEQDLCYESKMLRIWRAAAGTINHGPRAGTRIKLKNTEPNKLAVLTTRLPGSKEEERIIFAVFIIGLNYDGDGREEGFVTANKDYRIELTPDEAKGMLFWKYYKNKTTDAVIWGTGLYRYLDDAVAVKILKDIVRIKAETDPTEAKALLHHYMTVNKIAEGED